MNILLLPPRLKQIPSAQVTEKIAGASQKAAISDVGDKVIKTLSKGYRQRVGLAQALIHDPEVLVLDEPTIGLDPIQIREVREMIKSLAHEHTIILSTHILPEVDMTCDSVVIIDRGKIIAQDTPDGLAKSLEGAEKLTIMAEGPAEEISAAVKDIRGVQKVVESTSENGVSTLTLECDFQFHVRKGLSEVMSEKGWGLLEMKVEETTLEDVFIHLMSDSSEEVVS